MQIEIEPAYRSEILNSYSRGKTSDTNLIKYLNKLGNNRNFIIEHLAKLWYFLPYSGIRASLIGLKDPFNNKLHWAEEICRELDGNIRDKHHNIIEFIDKRKFDINFAQLNVLVLDVLKISLDELKLLLDKLFNSENSTYPSRNINSSYSQFYTFYLGFIRYLASKLTRDGLNSLTPDIVLGVIEILISKKTSEFDKIIRKVDSINFDELKNSIKSSDLNSDELYDKMKYLGLVD